MMNGDQVLVWLSDHLHDVNLLYYAYYRRVSSIRRSSKSRRNNLSGYKKVSFSGVHADVRFIYRVKRKC